MTDNSVTAAVRVSSRDDSRAGPTANKRCEGGSPRALAAFALAGTHFELSASTAGFVKVPPCLLRLPRARFERDSSTECAWRKLFQLPCRVVVEKKLVGREHCDAVPRADLVTKRAPDTSGEIDRAHLMNLLHPRPRNRANAIDRAYHETRLAAGTHVLIEEGENFGELLLSHCSGSLYGRKQSLPNAAVGCSIEALEDRVLMAMSLKVGGLGFSNLLATDSVALRRQKLIIDPPGPLAGWTSTLHDATKVSLVGVTPGPGYANLGFGGFVEIREGNTTRLQPIDSFLRQPAGVETGVRPASVPAHQHTGQNAPANELDST